jgi:hypothetical protein
LLFDDFNLASTIVERMKMKLLNRCRTMMAGVMLALWVLTLSLSVSPTLHHIFHHDSDSSAHECLVTAFHKGQLTDAVFDAPVVVKVLTVSCVTCIPCVSRLVTPEVSLPSSRGPPSLLSA